MPKKRPCEENCINVDEWLNDGLSFGVRLGVRLPKNIDKNGQIKAKIVQIKKPAIL